mmetsp:Transcript_3193/g.7098  ORF Transcript_3193/g.7098 Transcript_3193/m.7098 type:complete len:294 (+) Transcript_3193:475-1356(+)
MRKELFFAFAAPEREERPRLGSEMSNTTPASFDIGTISDNIGRDPSKDFVRFPTGSAQREAASDPCSRFPPRKKGALDDSILAAYRDENETARNVRCNSTTSLDGGARAGGPRREPRSRRRRERCFRSACVRVWERTLREGSSGESRERDGEKSHATLVRERRNMARMALDCLFEGVPLRARSGFVRGGVSIFFQCPSPLCPRQTVFHRDARNQGFDTGGLRHVLDRTIRHSHWGAAPRSVLTRGFPTLGEICSLRFSDALRSRRGHPSRSCQTRWMHWGSYWVAYPWNEDIC